MINQNAFSFFFIVLFVCYVIMLYICDK